VSAIAADTMSKTATNIFFGIVTAILIGVLGWIGKNTSDSNDRLARIETSLPFIQASMTELKNTFEGLKTSVEVLRSTTATRTEVDTKILDIRTELVKLTTAQQRLELDLIRLQSQSQSKQN
jgi:hypothetical protein